MAGEKLASEADLKGHAGAVLGGEGDGLRELTRKNCDFLVRLPQTGLCGEPERLGCLAHVLYERFGSAPLCNKKVLLE